MLYVLCCVWQVEIFGYEDFSISDHQSLRIASESLFFVFISTIISFCHYGAFRTKLVCLSLASLNYQVLVCISFGALFWNMEGWKFVIVNKGEFLNQMAFCKWRCFADLEVDFPAGSPHKWLNGPGQLLSPCSCSCGQCRACVNAGRMVLMLCLLVFLVRNTC